MAKPALGRGLGALLGGVSSGATPTAPLAQPASDATGSAPVGGEERVARVALSRIRPSPFQPRKDFSDEGLRELADSIREQGVVQPLIVRRNGEEYELIAGERRWRAARLGGLEEVPVLVRDADDATVLEWALIENLQRENLNPLEEAQGYQQLIDLFQLRQEEVALKVGKSRVAVANAVRLLKLPAEVQAYLRNGHLSAGHAKVVLGLATPDEQRLAAERVIKAGLNVRQTEDLVAAMQARAAGAPSAKTSGGRGPVFRDAHVVAVESRLQERFGTKVNLRYRHGRGAVEIRFFNDDDLERILQVVGVGLE